MSGPHATSRQLSFICVSNDETRVAKLWASVRATFAAGTGFEIECITIDGRRFDLFQGYNEGIRRASYDVLVFLHDDVQVLSNCLAFVRPLELLADPATGFVGVAGTCVMPRSGVWWEVPVGSARGMTVYPARGTFAVRWHVSPWFAAKFGRVAVLDGLFFMTRRAVLEQLGGFDATAYQGFHYYDVDTTFRATLAGLVNYCAPIALHHMSTGRRSEEWERNRRIFLSRFGHELPYEVPVDAAERDEPLGHRMLDALYRAARHVPGLDRVMDQLHRNRFRTD
jgi:hypothetical protein